MNTDARRERRSVGCRGSGCCGFRRHYCLTTLSGHPRALAGHATLTIVNVVLVLDVHALGAVLNTGAGCQRRSVGCRGCGCCGFGSRGSGCRRPALTPSLNASLSNYPRVLASHATLTIVNFVLVRHVHALGAVSNTRAGGQRRSVGCLGSGCRGFGRHYCLTTLSDDPRPLTRHAALAVVHVFLVRVVHALGAVLNTGAGCQRCSVGCLGSGCRGFGRHYCLATLSGDPRALTRHAALAIVNVVLVLDVHALGAVLNTRAGCQGLSLHTSAGEKHDEHRNSAQYCVKYFH